VSFFKSSQLTPRRLAAKRRNAQHSTGPRTAGGKRHSSRNSRRHGLYSNARFFRDGTLTLGEDPREFRHLLDGLIEACLPADTLEMAPTGKPQGGSQQTPGGAGLVRAALVAAQGQPQGLPLQRPAEKTQNRGNEARKLLETKEVVKTMCVIGAHCCARKAANAYFKVCGSSKSRGARRAGRRARAGARNNRTGGQKRPPLRCSQRNRPGMLLKTKNRFGKLATEAECIGGEK
jgi:hypothetical protein